MKNISHPSTIFIRSHPFDHVSPEARAAYHSVRFHSDQSTQDKQPRNRQKRLFDDFSRPKTAEDKKTEKKENLAINFSPRTLDTVGKDVHKPKPDLTGNRVNISDLIKVQNIQSNINIFQWKPDVSRDILLKSRLEKFLPKKDLQPKVYPHKDITEPAQKYDGTKHQRLLDKLLDSMDKTCKERMGYMNSEQKSVVVASQMTQGSGERLRTRSNDRSPTTAR